MRLVFRSIVYSCICSAGISSALCAETITLEQTIREVCSKSDSIAMMKQTMKKSNEIVREKWANALPVVSLSGALGQARVSSAEGMFKPMIKHSYGTSASFNQPIFTFGKVGTAVKVATQFDSSTHSSYGRSLQQLQMSGVDAFFGVVLADMSVSVSERSIERKKELSEFLDRNFKLGSGAKAQLLMTQADIISGTTEIITARQRAKSARMMFCSQIGRPLTDSIDPDTNSILPFLVTLRIPNSEEAVSMALSKRGDYRSLDYIEKATRGGAKIFQAMYYPTIGANGSAGFNGNKVDSLFLKDKFSWSLGVGMSWTIFDGFANSARSKQYLSDADRLIVARKTVAKMIEIEVVSDLAECSAADTNMVASEQMLAAAKESYDLTNETFKMGSGQFSDLQLAEDRLRQAELGIVNARYRLLKSRAAVLVACGNDIVNVEGK